MGKKKNRADRKATRHQHNAHVIPVVDKSDDTATEVKPTAENLGFAQDQRQVRIELINEELTDRKRFIHLVDKCGGYDGFIASTLKLEGRLLGLEESLKIAPPSDAPTPAVFQEGK